MNAVMNEWRANWRIVICALLGATASLTQIYSMGVLLPHISAEMGWSRAEASSGVLVGAIGLAVISPIVGRLVDRGRLRACALGGAVVFGIAIACLGLLRVSLPWWLAIWGVVAIGSGLTNLAVWAPAITQRFSAGRGLALAIVMCGSGLSAAIFPVAASALAAQLGWRYTYAALGIGVTAVCLPIYALWIRDVVPVAGAAGEDHAATARTVDRAIYSTPAFLRLAALSLVLTSALSAMTVHFPLVLAEHGMTAGQTGRLAGLIGIGAIGGRLAIGAIIDRANAAVVAALAMLCPLTAMALLLYALPSHGMAGSAAGTLIGVGIGSEAMVIAYITGRLFPTETFGAVWGVLIAFMAIASGVGPVVAGRAFDLNGNYAAVLLGNCVIFALAIATFLSLAGAVRVRRA